MDADHIFTSWKPRIAGGKRNATKHNLSPADAPENRGLPKDDSGDSLGIGFFEPGHRTSPDTGRPGYRWKLCSSVPSRSKREDRLYPTQFRRTAARGRETVT